MSCLDATACMLAMTVACWTNWMINFCHLYAPEFQSNEEIKLQNWRPLFRHTIPDYSKSEMKFHASNLHFTQYLCAEARRLCFGNTFKIHIQGAWITTPKGQNEMGHSEDTISKCTWKHLHRKPKKASPLPFSGFILLFSGLRCATSWRRKREEVPHESERQHHERHQDHGEWRRQRI